MGPAPRHAAAPDALVIRPARSGDAERIAELSAPFVTQGLLLPRVLNELTTRTGDFLVACDGPRLVGCAGTAASGGSLLIYNLCVVASWQGRGVGRRLVGAAETIGRQRGHRSLLALTRHGGDWFGALGFSEVPESEARDEWRTLFRPGRRSSLYQLRLISEQSEDGSAPACPA